MGSSLRLVRTGLLLSGLTLVGASTGACSSAPADDEALVAVDESAGPLTRSFATSAARAGVPRDLLVAIAKVEDGLGMPARRPDLDVDNEVPVAGPLQLRRGKLDTLARGSALTGISELELRIDADLALEAGALVLAELGAKTGAKAGELASWNAAIEEMSGFADEPHRESYAHEVFATLARGGSFEGRDGETIVLPRHDIPPSLTLDVSMKIRALAGAQYPGAEFFPTSCTNKCTPGRAGNAVEYIVIHDTEGGWNASVATLQNDPNKSCQYIIDTNGRIGQFVSEETTAWHAGNFHYNQRSIGIEHVGYATKPFAEAEYVASAKLVAHLTTKYGIPRDRAHIIGHDQIPDGTRIGQAAAPCASSPKACQSSANYGGAGNHTDPGIWEWAVYMERFGGTAKCNDVTDLFNCSNDKKHAFRCTGGKVEVATCDGPGGCEVQPNGVDDICDVKPKTAPPPASEPDPTAAPEEDEEPATTGSPFREPARGELAAEGADSEGCSVGPTGGKGSSPMTALLLGMALAASGLRRRVRFRSRRSGKR